jgi:glycosyltransferase involved in cell wall biosynthesis
VGDGKLRQQLGLAARRCYEARFRFERMAKETLGVYREFTSRIKI